METVTLDLARVVTPDTTYLKARAVLEPGRLVISDRRHRELAVIEGERAELNRSRWTYGDVVVERMSGCGCGGTRVMPT